MARENRCWHQIAKVVQLVFIEKVGLIDSGLWLNLLLSKAGRLGYHLFGLLLGLIIQKFLIEAAGLAKLQPLLR